MKKLYQKFIKRRLIRLMKNQWTVNLPYGKKVINVEEITHCDIIQIHIIDVPENEINIKKERKILKLQNKL